MAYPVMPLGFIGSQGDNDSYRIERSLRFNSGDYAYLSRTPASTTNRKTWTYSTWIKRTKLSASTIFFGWNGSNTSTVFQFTSTDNLELYNFAGAYYAPRLITNQVLRDVSAWYHIVLVWDADNATSADRQRIYINGVRVTSFSTESYSNDIAYGINVASYPHAIGGGVGSDFDGYMTEIYFIDGQALTPSSFGETDAITGRWKAKAYSGTYGTNGFYLKFSDNSGTTSTTLGKDSSPNGNNWTPNNFSVTAGTGNDSLVDSPTNYGSDTGVGGEVRGNYCVWNRLSNTGLNISNGSLDIIAGGTDDASVRGTIGIASGKWYWEATCLSISAAVRGSVGVATSTQLFGYFSENGNKFDSGGASAYGAIYSTNDVIGVAFDADNGTLTFYRNNTSQGTAFTGLTSGPYFPFVTTASGGSFAHNFGQRPFAYTAPTGFKALCTTNLPTPTIKKPSSYMDVVTYTGNGSTQTISSLGFSPDLVWMKNRTASADHAIYDTLRTLMLSSNQTAAEVPLSGVLTYSSNGFAVGGSDIRLNTASNQYVAWAWDEAPIAGMDIVSYTGTGAIRTVAHNLGVAPKMIIAKLTNSAGFQWPVYHSSLTSASSYIWLNSTNAQATDSAYWGTAPTSSVFSVGTNANVNNNTSPYIAYCFAEVEGFSKFGSYTGNSSADGPFVWCGFRPRFVLTKNSSSGGAGYDWVIWDAARNPSNQTAKVVFPDLANAEEETTTIIDILSSGFKLRNSGATTNAGTMIFAAFAESPFKYARAR